MKIHWPKGNYRVYIGEVPWSFERETTKIHSTTIDKLKDFYEKSFLTRRQGKYSFPLFSMVLDFHSNAKYRRKFNKLISSNEGGVILPTGMYHGIALSYTSKQDAAEKAEYVAEKGDENIEKDRKSEDQRRKKENALRKKQREKNEKRIPTGVRNTTVLDPSTFDGGDYARSWFKKKKIQIQHYSGKPSGFTLTRVQQNNYQALSDILVRNGSKFDYVGAATYTGQASYQGGNIPTLTRFVMTAPGLVWEKYEGISAGGGRNTVYVGGKRLKTTEFLSLKSTTQDKLVQAK